MISCYSRKLVALGFAFLILIWQFHPAFGAGLLIIKGENAAPEFAKVVPFTKCERFAVSYKVTPQGGGERIFQANEVFAVLEYEPTLLNADMIGSGDFLWIEDVVRQSSTLSEKFPSLRRMLSQFIKPLTDILSHRDNGDVQFRGNWVSRANYDNLLKAEAQRIKDAEMARVQAAEQQRLSEQRRLEDQRMAVNKAEAEMKASEEKKQKEAAAEAEKIAEQRRVEAADLARREENFKKQARSLV